MFHKVRIKDRLKINTTIAGQKDENTIANDATKLAHFLYKRNIFVK